MGQLSPHIITSSKTFHKYLFLSKHLSTIEMISIISPGCFNDIFKNAWLINEKLIENTLGHVRMRLATLEVNETEKWTSEGRGYAQ